MDCGQYCQAWWGSWWPWAEANQGFLSVLALIVALALFLIEQRAANLARAEAAYAEAQRVRSELALENERRALALEAERRERVASEAATAEAERRAVERQIQSKIEATHQFFAACEGLVSPLINSITPSALNTIGENSRISSDIVAIARETAGALEEILRAIPLHPGLIIGMKREISAVFAVADLSGTYLPTQDLQTVIEERRTALKKAHAAMEMQALSHVARLSQELPLSPSKLS